MADIRDIDLRKIDTTLLMVFVGCMRHRKATAVAEEMGLTQPAVSHALKRLRGLYGDPLFLRRAHGLEPTALARELEPKFRQVIWLLSETLTSPAVFDPKESRASLRIGAFDYELNSIVTDLIAHLRNVSPGVSVQAYSLTNKDALDALLNGQIDLALGYFDFPTQGADMFIADELYAERYVVAARRAHPLFSQELSLEGFADADHLMVAPFGPTKTLVDLALKELGYQRVVQTAVPSLFSAFSIIERTELLLTLPERLAARNMHRFNLAIRPLPFEAGVFNLHMVRHARDAENGLHKWLVTQLKHLTTGDFADNSRPR